MPWVGDADLSGALALWLGIHCQPLSDEVSSLHLPGSKTASGLVWKEHLTGQAGPRPAAAPSPGNQLETHVLSPAPAPPHPTLLCFPSGLSTEGQSQVLVTFLSATAAREGQLERVAIGPCLTHPARREMTISFSVLGLKM